MARLFPGFHQVAVWLFLVLGISLAACAAAPRLSLAPGAVSTEHPALPTGTPTLLATAPPLTIIQNGPTATPLRSVTLESTALPTLPPASPSPLPVTLHTAREVSTAVIPAIANNAPTAIPLTERQHLLDEVWRKINDNYLYADFRGVDWAAVRAEFAPQIIAETSNQAFYDMLAEMVARLDDQHSRFLPPSAAVAEDVRSSGREEQVGIGVVTIALADAALIQQVFAGSPAAEAVLLPRDRIVAIDGRFYAQSSIEGPEGSQVRLTIVRPGEEGRDVVLTRRLVEGRISPLVRRLDNDIGYLAITTLWVSDMGDQVAEALQQLEAERPLRGVILDLRGNPGGWRDVLTGILSHFVRGEVGHFFNRYEETPLLIEPGPGPDLRDRPLVVLIDGGTASYAELLAGILQRETDAAVVGAPSAGNTETIYAYNLAGGARLWVAQEGFRLRDRANLEGVGVQPDVLISLDWTRYSEEHDPGIMAGLKLVTTQAEAGK